MTTIPIYPYRKKVILQLLKIIFLFFFAFSLHAKSNPHCNETSANIFLNKNTTQLASLLLFTLNSNSQNQTQATKKTIHTIFSWHFIVYSIAIPLGLSYFLKIKTKYQQEKKQRKEIELQLTNYEKLVAQTNQQITLSSLKALESETFEKDLKKYLKNLKSEIPSKYHHKIEQLNSSIKNRPKNNWKEFEIHFQNIHKGFFCKLQEEYPDLTASELKLCSFLKLKLSSKEIANLMGITDRSVKMSRYRVRKKFNISREVNLVEFISKF
ncbi:helix-turn-helix transcriptional regulator [Tenacibaculum sp. M341]|uniref:helix-turn-helix transcriptional regulator n=1 Tax=Tenacibaculum sp. M341 TaxID=2530339 RepID=UPI001051D642|nr:hypothetical protein [Tenacibaculum sp. M341]TCI84505.1 hypothetical protein EYW44_21170 [Tenacibaculum sp. M341]